MAKFKQESLSNLIRFEKRTVQVDPRKKYEEIGIYSFGKGIFHKPPLDGSEIGNKKMVMIKDGDLIFNLTFAWEGAVAIASSREDGMYGSERYLTYRVNEEKVIPEYLQYFLVTPLGLKQLKKISPGSALRNRVFNKNRIDEILIPLPPDTFEQKLIIEKINKIKTQNMIVQAKLQKVKQLLETFSQSLLSKAFSGDLIIQEPTLTYEEIILDIQQKIDHWMKERQNNKTSVKKSKKLKIVDSKNLSKTPDHWVWAKLDSICEKITDGTHNSPPNSNEGEFMYVTAKNIKTNGFDFSNLTFVSETEHRKIYARCNPQKGDVLYTKDGTIGIAMVNELEKEFSMLSSVALIKPMRTILNPYFLKYYLNSPETFIRMTGKKKGTSLKRIILGQINNMEIPIPTLEEQEKIVKKLDELFPELYKLKQLLEESGTNSTKLDIAVLSQAFQGNLIKN